MRTWSLCIVIFGCSSAPQPLPQASITVGSSPAASASEPAAPPHLGKECNSKDECAPDAPFCVGLDRDGKLEPEDPWKSACASPCEKGACPKGYRCGTLERVKLVTVEGKMHYEPISHSVCLADVQFGTAALGDSCSRDEECGREAPFCINLSSDERRCSRPCEDDCPEGYACRVVQRFSRYKVLTRSYCIR